MTESPPARDHPEPNQSRVRRGIAWTRVQLEESKRRAHEARKRSPVVDAAFDIAERDTEVGGGILAGALAYRLFIWLLPFALVVIGGLGLWSSASERPASEVARHIGLGGFVASSVATAAHGNARWYALLIGVPLLVLTTRSLLRALTAAHYLVWSSRVPRGRPSLRTTLLFLLALVGYFAATSLAGLIREHSGVGGVAATLVVVLAYFGIWLGVSHTLPHADAAWHDLVPGAAVYGLGTQVLHLVAIYFVVPQAAHREQTYGTIGIAAALLLGLFFLGRLVVLSAVVSSTLWQRSALRAAECEREDKLRDPARERGSTHPDDEKNGLVTEVAGRPKPQ